tara:strand:- start:34 stop:273 length:240 start_codon:yes stop_codon:yes gene_type:complete
MENVLMNPYLIVTAFGSIEMVELQRDLTEEDCLAQVMQLSIREDKTMFGHVPFDENGEVLHMQLVNNSPVYVCYYSKVT